MASLTPYHSDRRAASHVPIVCKNTKLFNEIGKLFFS